MSRVDELKQRLAAIREVPKIRKHQFTGTPFVKSNDDLTKMKTTHFLELAADKLGKPNTGSITGLADAHSNPSYDSKYFKGLERGDELGVVEQKKQNIRHKGKSGVPMLINWKGKNQITGHEGRHLGRALLEEGFDEIPVEFTEGFMNTDPAKKYKNTKNLIRQNKNKMPNLKDTRAPIFGRKAKLKQRLARIPYFDTVNPNMKKQYNFPIYESSGFDRAGRPNLNKPAPLRKEVPFPYKDFFASDTARGTDYDVKKKKYVKSDTVRHNPVPFETVLKGRGENRRPVSKKDKEGNSIRRPLEPLDQRTWKSRKRERNKGLTLALRHTEPKTKADLKKIYPPTPTQADRSRIIQARLKRLQQ